MLKNQGCLILVKEGNTKTNALNIVDKDEQEDEIHPANATPSQRRAKVDTQLLMEQEIIALFFSSNGFLKAGRLGLATSYYSNVSI